MSIPQREGYSDHEAYVKIFDSVLSTVWIKEIIYFTGYDVAGMARQYNIICAVDVI
jgi:hypothetical protein